MYYKRPFMNHGLYYLGLTPSIKSLSENSYEAIQHWLLLTGNFLTLFIECALIYNGVINYGIKFITSYIGVHIIF